MKKITLALLMALGMSAAYAEAPKPMLWKVSDADNSLYLLGSFHLLKETDYPLAKSTDAAFEDAEQLYFEISAEEMNNPVLGQKMAQTALRTDGKTLQSSLPEKTWKQFEAYANERKLPVANFQNFEPWFVTLMLSVMEMQKMGLNPALGLDKHFMDRATKAGKVTKGLETGESQISMLDGMTAIEQQQQLQDMLDDSANMKKEIENLHNTWRKGDDKALFDEMAMEMKKQYPELYQSINPKRNTAWMPKLEALLKDNNKDDIMVVVGALHLIGEDGVVKMLADKGYKIERVTN
jgi:uncharacterized protein